jgi:hypothetical protein
MSDSKIVDVLKELHSAVCVLSSRLGDRSLYPYLQEGLIYVRMHLDQADRGISDLSAKTDLPPTGHQSEVVAVGGWRQIDTAPKDGTAFLMFNLDWSSRFQIARWYRGRPRPTGEDGWGKSPTHWMAIPPMPSADTASAETEVDR